MFAFHIDQNGQSKMHLGGYDLKKYASSDIKWYDVKGKHFWQFNIENVKLGDIDFTPSTNVAIADSGTSMNMIPDADFFKITDTLLKGWNCWDLKNDMKACDCTKEAHEKIPDITFDIEGDQYVIERNQWFERSNEGLCYNKFQHAPGRVEWILGLQFH
jgi:hypothetical protein